MELCEFNEDAIRALLQSRIDSYRSRLDYVTSEAFLKHFTKKESEREVNFYRGCIYSIESLLEITFVLPNEESKAD